MNRHRVIAVTVGLLIASSALIHAQGKQLSVRGRALSDALAELQKKPDDPVVRERYLKLFPRDYKSFQKFFDLNQELYDGSGFIKILPTLAKNDDSEVGDLLVGLSKDAHWQGDASSYLQQAMATYAGLHTKSFAFSIDRLLHTDHVNLIAFLADVENHSAYTEYQAIIDHLRSLRRSDLANEFEAARKKRSRQPHG